MAEAMKTGALLPEFDIDSPSMTGILGQIVRTVLPHSEADPFGLLMTALSRSSAFLGSGAYVPVSAGSRQPARLYVILVGSTARARKGVTESDIGSIFDLVDPTFAETRIKSGLSSGEGLLKALSRKDDEPDLDPRLLVVETEFASVLTVLGREGNTISTAIRDLWDRGRTATMTKKDPINVENAHLCIMSHITEEELHRKLSTVDIANGFANRFLFAHVQRSKRLPHGGSLSDTERDLLASQWRQALAKGSEIHGPIRRNEEAMSLWEDWYNELDDDVPGLYGSLVARAEAHVTRISLIYALLDGSPVITAKHHLAALDIWQRCEATIQRLYPQAETTGNKEADRILDALRARGSLTRSELTRSVFSNHITDTQLDNAVGILIEVGKIQERTIDTKGRPRTEYHLVE